MNANRKVFLISDDEGTMIMHVMRDMRVRTLAELQKYFESKNNKYAI